MRAKNSWNKEYETVNVEKEFVTPDGKTSVRKCKVTRMVKNGLKSSPKEIAFSKHVKNMEVNKK